MTTTFDLFYTGALSVLKQHKLVSSSETDNTCDAVLVSTSEWKDHFEGEKYPNADECIEKKYNKTPVAALMDFSEWIEAGKWQGMPKTIELSTVSMTVTIPLATGSSIALSASAILLPGGHVGVAYTELYDQIVLGYETFRQSRQLKPAATSNGANSTGSNHPNNSSAKNGNSTDKSVVPVETVKVENKNGKRIIRLGGDIWSKFGVTCWPEVFEAAGWHTDDYELGDNPAPKGWLMRLVMNDNNKPTKVKELFRA